MIEILINIFGKDKCGFSMSRLVTRSVLIQTLISIMIGRRLLGELSIYSRRLTKKNLLRLLIIKKKQF